MNRTKTIRMTEDESTDYMFTREIPESVKVRCRKAAQKHLHVDVEDVNGEWVKNYI